MKKKQLFSFFILLQLLFFLSLGLSFAEEGPKTLKTAIFGTGCFWCSQEDIEKLKGVKSALPGYSGGTLKNPTYKKHPGHIEVVKITYDPVQISFQKLVKKVWVQQIPTDDGGSFCDRGHSYRNVFFYGDKDEEKILKKTKDSLEKILGEEVKTIIKKRTFFTTAEKYHIHYAKKNPLRYKYYRYGCGRDKALKNFWNRDKIKKSMESW